ncbi:MAG: ester cyclase [Ignavibacteriaceae bacterium]
MKTQQDLNKEVVISFNKEVIEQGNLKSFRKLVDDNVINHAAPAGASSGPDSMSYFIFDVLRKGFDIKKVNILEQVAENDKVVSRKEIHAVHTGHFMEVPATNKNVTIKIIDIIRVKDGKYAEHWGIGNISDIIKELSE